DDEQWLDRASAQVLGFVARRVGAESVGLVFGARVPSAELAGLPELVVEGLREDDARALLRSVVAGPLDARVFDAIVVETGGNPLALLELPRGLSAADLAGGFGLPGAVALPGGVEESFRRRADALPADTRRLLQLAAADPLGDPVLLWRAAARLGIGASAWGPAEGEGLVKFGMRVRFRHPLVRSAAYWSASAEERREVHAALAEATDSEVDPDRRAWHRAHAAAGPDEEVAVELEHGAGRAQARGGLAAGAAFLQYAALLTPDPAQRAGRALAAAQAKIQAGAFDETGELLAMADAGPLTEVEHARVDLTRTQLALATRPIGEAAAGFLEAAKRLEPVDAALARATHLTAMALTFLADRSAPSGGDVVAVARAARAFPSPRPAGVADLLLDGLAVAFDQGYAAGVPILCKALTADTENMPREQELHWVSLALPASFHVWDDDRWMVLTDRYLQLSRELGAMNRLPTALNCRAQWLVFAGELAAAASLVDEAQVVTEAMWSRTAPYGAITLAALRGDKVEASALVSSTLRDAMERGEGLAGSAAEWAMAVLNNGLGRHQDALAAAGRASENPHGMGYSNWALAELIEAAVRTGLRDAATGAHGRLAEMAAASDTDWALGLEARSRALLSDGQQAETLYRESMARLSQTHVRTEFARSQLLYGEWLRRERRRGEAREQLRSAHAMLEAMGMVAFAERAVRELRATGETAARRSVETTTDLTAQEAHVAKLARDGLSNPEIGARLFISARTVQYHLSKVFTKLDITSRGQLDRVLV
ncbi:MAG TPA: LuxR C-terminal-related transcriptional regulator, partial [Solirubrobacteraceae bacterium]|nr:LuxR C-terminal-related transcriptional regulator [Solirubrobacteraceae bacterium]